MQDIIEKIVKELEKAHKNIDYQQKLSQKN